MSVLWAHIRYVLHVHQHAAQQLIQLGSGSEGRRGRGSAIGVHLGPCLDDARHPVKWRARRVLLLVNVLDGARRRRRVERADCGRLGRSAGVGRRSGRAPAAQVSVVSAASASAPHYARRRDAGVGRCDMRTVEELGDLVVVQMMVLQRVVVGPRAGRRRRIAESARAPLAGSGRSGDHERRTARRSFRALFQNFGVKRAV